MSSTEVTIEDVASGDVHVIDAGTPCLSRAWVESWHDADGWCFRQSGDSPVPAVPVSTCIIGEHVYIQSDDREDGYRLWWLSEVLG